MNLCPQLCQNEHSRALRGFAMVCGIEPKGHPGPHECGLCRRRKK